MATASRTNRESMRSRVDRFSNLPIELAYLVCSNLSFKDLIRVSCVSKRCRELYVSTPYLNFHDFSDVDGYNKKIVLESIDGYFIQRGFDHNIQCFRFRWDNNLYIEWIMLRLSKWIDNAVRCNVEALHIVISSKYQYLLVLSSSVLLCGSLKSLLLEMNNLRIDVPPMDCPSNLECLKLKRVSVQDDVFLKWISSCCKSLEELVLVNVSGLNSLVIESSSLRSFTYKCDRFDGRVNISGDRLEKLHASWPVGKRNLSVNISAPNLKCLKWFGDFTSRHKLGMLRCLEKAEICSYFSCCNFNALFAFLCSIPRVEVLVLNMAIVRCLGLNIDYLKLQDLPFISQVKEVGVQLYDNPDVYQFARYIFEHAQHMEKMAVYYSSRGHGDGTVAKLKRKSTTNAAVSFHRTADWSLQFLLDFDGCLDFFNCQV